MKIFVSTPSQDLAETRKSICSILDDNNIIPLSMEQLIATCNPPWNELTKKIDEADYFFLVIGDEYGSADENGNGYTEKEFKYAQEKDIPIIGFIKSYNRNNKDKLCNFKNSVADDRKRTVCFWDKIEQIGPLVIKAIKKIQNEENENKYKSKSKTKIGNDNICSSIKVYENRYTYKNELLIFEGFLPNYPHQPTGSCLINFLGQGLEKCVVTLDHIEIMDLFLKEEKYGEPEYSNLKDNKVNYKIGNTTFNLQANEIKSLKEAIASYEQYYLKNLNEITRFLQINDFKKSLERNFSYRIIKVKYDFWMKLLKYSYEHDYMSKSGLWDMFSPNGLALNIIHPINCNNNNYDGVMHAYFNVENDYEIGSQYVWLVLNLGMTKSYTTNLLSYSKRTIWPCQIAYNWCVNEFFPEVCKSYNLNREDNYEIKDTVSKSSDRTEISDLQMFVIENNIKFTDEEIKAVKNALIYCLSSKILPLDEYYYIKGKLDLTDMNIKTKDPRQVSNEIIKALKKEWTNNEKEIDVDYYLRCINAFTDGQSKVYFSNEEVKSVYLILESIIKRMNRYKFIVKYRCFYN